MCIFLRELKTRKQQRCPNSTVDINAMCPSSSSMRRGGGGYLPAVNGLL